MRIGCLLSINDPIHTSEAFAGQEGIWDGVQGHSTDNCAAELLARCTQARLLVLLIHPKVASIPCLDFEVCVSFVC